MDYLEQNGEVRSAMQYEHILRDMGELCAYYCCKIGGKSAIIDVFARVLFPWFLKKKICNEVV